MLGLIFLFFVGYYYYRLAEDHGKNKWLFGFIGLVCYYGTTFVTSTIYHLFYKYTGSLGFDVSLATLIPVGLGILMCILLYQILEHKWKKEEAPVDEKTINEIGKQ